MKHTLTPSTDGHTIVAVRFWQSLAEDDKQLITHVRELGSMPEFLLQKATETIVRYGCSACIHTHGKGFRWYLVKAFDQESDWDFRMIADMGQPWPASGWSTDRLDWREQPEYAASPEAAWAEAWQTYESQGMLMHEWFPCPESPEHLKDLKASFPMLRRKEWGGRTTFTFHILPRQTINWPEKADSCQNEVA